MVVKSKGKAKDYIAIAKKRINRPRDVTVYPKVLAYARNKKGKTRFALSAGIDQTILIDPEKGTETMRKLNPWRWPVTKWEDMNDVLGALRTGELSPHLLSGEGPEEPFKWVAVDGLSKINNFALRYIMRISEERDLDRRPGIVDRRDYNKSGELLKEMLAQFHALEMGVVYTCQERMESYDAGDSDEDDESTFFVPDLPKGVRGMGNALVDVIARLYVVRVDINGKLKPQRRLQIGAHERYDTGYRSDYELPDMVKNPTLPKLVQMMLEGPPPPKKKPARTRKAGS